MKSIVVDASVAIKWFIPEVHAIDASRLLQTNFKFLVPDLIFAEVGNILWKKCRRKELTLDIANEILDDFKRLPFNPYESEQLIDSAWHIANAHQCTIYDSLYLALSQSEGCLFVTADRTLCNILRTTYLANSLLWIEDVKNIT